MKNGQRRGFTLVELLVVIGIIALLISILLPSLNRARESAKRVACASLLRQVGIAARAYAADNKDAIPPMNLDDGSPGYNIGGTVNYLRTLQFVCWGNIQNNSATSFAVAAGEGPGFNAFTSPAPQVGSGIGRLCARGYMKGNARKYVSCPSTDGSSDLTNPNDQTRYPFNVHWAYFNNGSGGLSLQPWWKKLSQYGRVKGDIVPISAYSPSTAPTTGFVPRDLALASDPVSVPNTVNNGVGVSPHYVKNNRAYNLLFADGSVQTAIVPNTRTRQNTGAYAGFLDVLGWAESAVSGKPMLAPTSNANYHVTAKIN